MTAKPVVALAVVGADVQQIYDYFDTRLIGGGELLLQRYFETVDQIARNADSFPRKFDDYHRALIRKTNCAVYYFQEAERSVIVAVVDARRNPNFLRALIRRRGKR